MSDDRNIMSGSAAGVPGSWKLWAGSIVRGVLVALIARYAPAMANDPAVRVGVEVVSIVLPVLAMAWISTRASRAYAGTVSGAVATEIVAMAAGVAQSAERAGVAMGAHDAIGRDETRGVDVGREDADVGGGGVGGGSRVGPNPTSDPRRNTL